MIKLYFFNNKIIFFQNLVLYIFEYFVQKIILKIKNVNPRLNCSKLEIRSLYLVIIITYHRLVLAKNLRFNWT